jgi:hypothetical protein
MSVENTMPQPAAEQLRSFLDALYGRARPGLLVELRLRAGDAMTQRFVDVGRLDEVARGVLERGAASDVYVGVLARWRAQGTRRDVAGGATVVWADCDGEHAAEALAGFRAAPSVVVRSGSGPNRHAYWLLEAHATVAEVQRANRRLAFALGADAGSAEAARILRPPATLNHKHDPPVPVVLEACAPQRRYTLHELVGDLPDPPAERRGAGGRRARRRGDPLRGVDPALYVQRLTDQAVGRSRKVRCPLHDDHVPSLHVYPTPSAAGTASAAGAAGRCTTSRRCCGAGRPGARSSPRCARTCSGS